MFFLIVVLSQTQNSSTSMSRFHMFSYVLVCHFTTILSPLSSVLLSLAIKIFLCFYLTEFALPISFHCAFVQHFPIFHPPTHSQCYCDGHSSHNRAQQCRILLPCIHRLTQGHSTGLHNHNSHSASPLSGRWNTHELFRESRDAISSPAIWVHCLSLCFPVWVDANIELPVTLYFLLSRGIGLSACFHTDTNLILIFWKHFFYWCWSHDWSFIFKLCSYLQLTTDLQINFIYSLYKTNENIYI